MTRRDPERLPPEVLTALERLGLGPPVEFERLSGGSIHAVNRVSDGRRSLVVKMSPTAPAGLFAREAAGLGLLRGVPGAPRVPEPHAHGPTFLILEYLASEPATPQGWAEFAYALARLHANTGPVFGGVPDNYLGAAPQPNPATTDGFVFFAEHRLGQQLRRARAGGWLSPNEVHACESLAQRLPEWIPLQPASVIHGDLWAGNAIIGPAGAVCLIDPAAHFGWAEADLAMTALFGGFPPAFYAAYAEARPMPAGWRERFPLYNLYHLLNHLNLFGAGYLGDVRATLARFA